MEEELPPSGCYSLNLRDQLFSVYQNGGEKFKSQDIRFEILGKNFPIYPKVKYERVAVAFNKKKFLARRLTSYK